MWINDGLMAIFFLLVGLEIKREIIEGELSSPKKAMLPIIAAMGGAAVPALIYVFFNSGSEFMLPNRDENDCVFIRTRSASSPFATFPYKSEGT